ncbi:MAG: ABC transporter ATP-binding protein [Candidatus Hodarchaeales archaeon]|jgi:oligopeptide/dipeptide ABC transporter ATP-binding protein
MPKTLLEAKNITMHFETYKGTVHAVDDVSFDIFENEIFGLVGESGCGKTTLARVLMGIYRPKTGEIIYKGNSLLSMKKSELRKHKRNVQMVFQDPYTSLDPLMNIERLLTEPLDVHLKIPKIAKKQKVFEMLEKVGLSRQHVNRYPYEFSGGQRQRIAIARALIINPEFVVADEPVSALDISVQAQILNLLMALQQDLKVTCLVIAHDLNVIFHICDRVAVMYLGKIVELSSVKSIFNNPLHPYTQALMSAIPVPDPRIKPKGIILSGEVPSPLDPPYGCRFNTRCPFKQKKCEEEEPKFMKAEHNHFVACHFYKKIKEGRKT